APSESFTSVPTAKLNELREVAGAFVSAHAHLLHLAESRDDGEMLSAGEALGDLVRSLRELAGEFQMVSVSSRAEFLSGVVREAAEACGVDVAFHLDGGETQIDARVLDELMSSVGPLLRSVVHHELASPARRRSAGTGESATIRLTASHTGAEVVLNITDDGVGTAATERKPEFRRAFGAARRTAERVGGSATLDVTAGEGSRVSLRLPVSAAVVEGLLTQVGDTRYMVRLSHIERCLDMRSVERLPGQDMIVVGGEAVPVRDVRKLFGVEPQGDETHVVLVTGEAGRMGLLVDQVFDTHQAAIHPLDRMLHGVAGIAGTMILGDGTPAMLLDVDTLSRDRARTSE
ncbi:MAG: chemotaxis protein CheW, partial [Alkalispirochaeta sp.]